MARFEITKQVYVPKGVVADMGTRMTIDVTEFSSSTQTNEPTGHSSSSSFVAEFPTAQSSSSSLSARDLGIFLYQRTSDGDYFVGVCSPLDYQHYPADDPGSGEFYRRTSGDWTFRNETVMDRFWTLIQSDVRALANSLKILATLDTQEVLTYEFTSDSRGSSSSGTTRSYIITRDAVTSYPAVTPSGYRLKITCQATNTDPKIFLHRADEPDRQRQVNNRPIAVCSPGDLVDYPVDAPNDAQWPNFFRKATFDVVTADISELQDGWNRIKSSISLLARALKAHQDDVTDTDVEQITGSTGG